MRKITDSMVEAGARALRSAEWELWEQRDDYRIRLLVISIYEAMEQASGHGSDSGDDSTF